MVAVASRRPSPYQVLRDDIVAGRLREQTLSEEALAERLSVSRTPVREALRRLEQDGLVHKEGRRFVVRARTPEEISEMYEVREVLEAAAARAAARRATAVDLVRIETAHERLSEAVEAEVEPHAMARLDGDFHRAIWVSARNDMLLSVLDRLATAMFSSDTDEIMTPGRRDMVREHEVLLAAIRSGDQVQASELALAHMAGAQERQLADLMNLTHPD